MGTTQVLRVIGSKSGFGRLHSAADAVQGQPHRERGLGLFGERNMWHDGDID
jgi:hypothetical protein